MKVSLVVLCSALACLALVAPGGAPASYPAPAQRLLVTSEASIGPEVHVLDEHGGHRATLVVSPGLNGGIAVTRRGTTFAYVQASGFVDPGDLPARIRKRFARLPRSTLGFGSFLHSTRPTGGGGFSIAFVSPVIAAWPGRPALRPDGRAIVFAQARRGKVHLVALSGDARRPRQVTRSPGRDVNPRWSPDGATIVFERHAAGESDLYSISPDGSNLRRLTYWRGRERWPDFSPDGRSLVFAADATGRFQLYVFPLGGSLPEQVVSSFGNDERPTWSPDGRWIAYSSDRDGDREVYLVSPDGRHQRKLTHNASEDLVQEWQPLRDPRPPLIRALPSSSPRGRAAELRFRLRDDSARVLVSAEFLYGGGGRFGSSSLGPEVVRTRPRRQHVLRVGAGRLPFGEDELDANALSRFRFCVSAIDPWGNASPQSCSTFRFR